MQPPASTDERLSVRSAQAHARARTHTHAHIRTRTRTYAHARACTCACMRTHVRMHARTHTHRRAPTRARTRGGNQATSPHAHAKQRDESGRIHPSTRNATRPSCVAAQPLLLSVAVTGPVQARRHVAWRLGMDGTVGGGVYGPHHHRWRHHHRLHSHKSHRGLACRRALPVHSQAVRASVGSGAAGGGRVGALAGGLRGGTRGRAWARALVRLSVRCMLALSQRERGG